MSISVHYNADHAHPMELEGEITFEDILSGVIEDNEIERVGVMNTENLAIPHGDDRQLRVYLRNPNNDVVSSTDSSSVLEIRETKSGAVTKSLSTDVPAEGMLGDQQDGELFFFLTTADLEVRQYTYRILTTLPTNKTYTVSRGLLNITL